MEDFFHEVFVVKQHVEQLALFKCVRIQPIPMREKLVLSAAVSYSADVAVIAVAFAECQLAPFTFWHHVLLQVSEEWPALYVLVVSIQLDLAEVDAFELAELEDFVDLKADVA